MNNTISSKVIIFLLGAILTQETLAWDFIVSRGGSSAYLDSQNVKIISPYVRATWVSNFEKPSYMKFGKIRLEKRSIVYKVLYNCKEKSFRVEESVWFDETFGMGQGHKSGRSSAQWFTSEHRAYANNLNIDVMRSVCRIHL